MASASAPRGVFLTNSASEICMRWIRIQAPGIEYSGRIELRAQAPMNRIEPGRERRENALGPIAAAKQRGMTAQRLRASADFISGAGGAGPAQRAAPLDEFARLEPERRCGGQHRYAPERTIARKERSGVLAQRAPELHGALRLDHLPAELRGRGFERRAAA